MKRRALAPLLIAAALPPVLAPLPASAAPVCPAGELGAAAGFAEFVRWDAHRVARTAGRVAVGGDARLGDRTGDAGFAAGPAPSAARDALVIAGRLDAHRVTVDGGGVRAGSIADRTQISAPAGISEGASPIDFGAAFARLRATSARWARLPANGTARRAGGRLVLAGTDPARNVFAVTAARLERARAVRIRVPDGASAIVNVSGDRYDMGAGPSRGVSGGGSPQRLFWNFPDAREVVHGTSWSGTVLAPGTAWRMGAGHVHGNLIVGSIPYSGPGAEVHGVAPLCPDPSVPLMEWPAAPEPRPITGDPAPPWPRALQARGTRGQKAPEPEPEPAAATATATVEPLAEPASEPRPNLANTGARERPAAAPSHTPVLLAMLVGAAAVLPIAVAVRRAARRRNAAR